MLPLLRGYEPDQTVLFDRGRPISARAFCGMAAAMSTRLPVARFAFNLCEGRAEFLIATAAALLARHALVLPPSRLARTRDELLDVYPDSYCFVDAPAGATDFPAAHVALRPEFERAHESSPVALWPPPMIPAAHIVAIMFTSGTTGTPQPHPKTWGDMCRHTNAVELLRRTASRHGHPGHGSATAHVRIRDHRDARIASRNTTSRRAPCLSRRPVARDGRGRCVRSGGGLADVDAFAGPGIPSRTARAAARDAHHYGNNAARS
jgi:hypothetical protein